jgi:hypothetical protein
MVKIIIKYEIWKGKRLIVARSEAGKIVDRRKIKGTKLHKIDFLKIFKQNNSFNENIKKIKRTNVTENYYLTTANKKSKDAKPNNKPYTTNKKYQYLVQGKYKGELIVARSEAVNRSPTAPSNDAEAKVDAWSKFLAIISQKYNSNLYDADIGAKILENQKNAITELMEGWVVW